jgi:hypothetical protein
MQGIDHRVEAMLILAVTRREENEDVAINCVAFKVALELR